jgi:hypothetical protein
MRMYYSVNESFLDVVPEIDQHEVRYSGNSDMNVLKIYF